MSSQKIICSICGRQIGSYNQSNNKTVYTESPIKFIGNNYYCDQCGKDLDQIGNYFDKIGNYFNKLD